MTKIGKTFLMFLEDERGATAVEYGLIAALMAVAAIASFSAFGNGLQNVFGSTTEGAGAAITDAASSL